MRYLAIDGGEQAGAGLEDGGEGELVGVTGRARASELVEVVKCLFEEVVVGEGFEEGVPDDEVGGLENGEGEERVVGVGEVGGGGDELESDEVWVDEGRRGWV